MDTRKRPAWEWIVFTAVIILAAFLMGSTYKFQQNSAKQHALHYQLQLLRTAELLYTSVNNKLPDSLKDMAEGTFRLPGDDVTRRYIEHPPMIVAGELLDPFGNPYTYDKKNGWIKSSTKGYEFW